MKGRTAIRLNELWNGAVLPARENYANPKQTYHRLNEVLKAVTKGLNGYQR
jgi:hypothetical protein